MEQSKAIEEIQAQQAHVHKLESEWKLKEAKMFSEMKQREVEMQQQLEQAEKEVAIAARVRAYDSFEGFESHNEEINTQISSACFIKLKTEPPLNPDATFQPRQAASERTMTLK